MNIIKRLHTIVDDAFIHSSLDWSNDLPSWWRHQRETFSALLALFVGNSPVTGEFPAQRPVTWSFDVFFDPRLNKRLSKQSWGWWFETPSRSLWRRCNDAAVWHNRLFSRQLNHKEFKFHPKCEYILARKCVFKISPWESSSGPKSRQWWQL